MLLESRAMHGPWAHFTVNDVNVEGISKHQNLQDKTSAIAFHWQIKTWMEQHFTLVALV